MTIELKIGKFKPEHIGQINFYLEALDRDVKKPNEKCLFPIHTKPVIPTRRFIQRLRVSGAHLLGVQQLVHQQLPANAAHRRAGECRGKQAQRVFEEAFRHAREL